MVARTINASAAFGFPLAAVFIPARIRTCFQTLHSESAISSETASEEPAPDAHRPLLVTADHRPTIRRIFLKANLRGHERWMPP